MMPFTLSSQEPLTKPHFGGRLLVSYALVLLGISLYPFVGWRNLNLPLFFFLNGIMPFYWSIQDLILNFVAYLPLGAIAALYFSSYLRSKIIAILIATIIAVSLSIFVETIQAFLETRISSNLDVLSNSFGGFFGALIACIFYQKITSFFVLLDQKLFVGVLELEFGITLIGLWLLTVFSPETLLFGTGDLRPWLGSALEVFDQLHDFVIAESFITAMNMLVIGFIVRSLFSDKVRSYRWVFGFFIIAITTRIFSSMLLISYHNAFDWLTEGSIFGILLGSFLLIILVIIPKFTQIYIVFFAFITSLILINFIPFNPYSSFAISVWTQGHFRNFNGLIHVISAIWPFIASFYLVKLYAYSKSAP